MNIVESTLLALIIVFALWVFIHIRSRIVQLEHELKCFREDQYRFMRENSEQLSMIYHLGEAMGYHHVNIKENKWVKK
jgi:hypothetical protein